MCSQGDGWIHVVRLNAIQLEIAKTDSLYRNSPNGETSPFLHLLIHHFSVAYDWSRDCIAMVGISVSRRGRMPKIQRSANGQVVLTLSGRIQAENVAELQRFLELERVGRGLILDLKDVTLVDRDAVRFLARCEVGSIEIKNCPAYIREWIEIERGQSNRRKSRKC